MALIITLALTGRPAGAQQTCQVTPGPNVAVCVVTGGSPNPEVAALNQVACILQAINQWRMSAINCLQTNVALWQTTVMYPTTTLRAMGTVLRRIRTLREEVENIPDWPAEFGEDAMNYVRLYSGPDQLNRTQYERMWGHSAGTGNDVQELSAWLGTLNQNTIQTRTINTWGIAGELPQDSWTRIGYEGALELGKNLGTPLEALRLHAQMSADQLRVRANTIRMDAQEIATTQALADQRRLQRLRRDAAGDLIAHTAAAGIPGR